MGKMLKMKNIIIISGLNLESSNRGTAALGYGSVSFLKEKGFLKQGCPIGKIRVLNKKWSLRGLVKAECQNIQGVQYEMQTFYITFLEYVLATKIGLVLPFGLLSRVLKNTSLIAAINGGDGFTDIYGRKKFQNCIIDCKYAVIKNIPLVILPQTLGPFKETNNYKWAKRILRHAQNVFVRDDRFVGELQKMGVDYEITKDLSAYMKPEKFDIDIKENAVGINISGLAYSNKYRDLSGKFDSYPALIDDLIKHFQEKGCPVYLIPHSYNYDKPDYADDDLEVTQLVYDKLENKSNIYFVKQNLISPQIKYVISKMTFFIGTRMHANFAAIYTKVPVFGLAYSYKFAGAFKANGLSEDQTYRIDNLPSTDIKKVVAKVEELYSKSI